MKRMVNQKQGIQGAGAGRDNQDPRAIRALEHPEDYILLEDRACSERAAEDHVLESRILKSGDWGRLSFGPRVGVRDRASMSAGTKTYEGSRARRAAGELAGS